MLDVAGAVISWAVATVEPWEATLAPLLSIDHRVSHARLQAARRIHSGHGEAGTAAARIMEAILLHTERCVA